MPSCGQAFRALGLDRRQALWAVRGLTDAPLPLFAAAEKGTPAPETVEPPVPLIPMAEGREVVEGYQSIGLSLRRHPVAFLRSELRTRGMIACSDLTTARDGSWVVVPGTVLVRQRPGSANYVTLITIEDETGVANLILWSSVFERQRRLVLSAGMLACHGRVQCEGKVVHVIARRLENLSDLLRSVGERTDTVSHREAHDDGATRDISPPDLRQISGISIPAWNFRWASGSTWSLPRTATVLHTLHRRDTPTQPSGETHAAT